MTQDDMKCAAALAALAYLPDDGLIGVGTGSTVNYFIDALAPHAHRITGAVSSSEASSARLQAAGIALVDLNEVTSLGIYVDGADEIDPYGAMIKGGGAALTREKIVAAVAKQFICITDDSKAVQVLGRFPIPVEVIPMARNQVMRGIQALGGTPCWRQGVITDNGNHIVDIHGVALHDPVQWEIQLNGLVGVVTCGIFAQRRADVLLMGTAQGVTTQHYPRA